jgi:hypothetical protein
VKNMQTNFTQTLTKFSKCSSLYILCYISIYGPQEFSEPAVPLHRFTPFLKVFQHRHCKNCEDSQNKEKYSEIWLVNDPENMKIFKGF